MSKLFFKGRIETRKNHVKSGYNVNRYIKAGSADAPITVTVACEARKTEIEAITQEQAIIANIVVDATREENTVELDTLLNRPTTATAEKTPSRNEPCLCGSGQKYKKCCA
ncbi:PBPRA1643 family SWIM/SEC-C metal-binding motif protein [Vibrio zhugei]|uniref:PBPRA1643 family SWIM/SEC-C metal-binding motif protein n=1 Tax=Vibrio zhugei TaxID=2479546 RepID=A0ABV7CD08_9VIBR|nr:PBPRA1643 family SWIM/SEC-C metal-binding motif protein [Vibrio zhugei]